VVGLLHTLSQLNEKSTIGIPQAQSQLDKQPAVNIPRAQSQLNKQSAIGISHAQSQLDKKSAIGTLCARANSLAESFLGRQTHAESFLQQPPHGQEPPTAFRPMGRISNFMGFRPKKEFRSEFDLACNDCLSTLLPHASHYSQELVNLLLEQQRTTQLPNICVKPAMIGPYLEVTILFLDKRSNQLMSY